MEEVGHRQSTEEDAYRIGEQQPRSERRYIGISHSLKTIRENGYNDRLWKIPKSAAYRVGWEWLWIIY